MAPLSDHARQGGAVVSTGFLVDRPVSHPSRGLGRYYLLNLILLCMDPIRLDAPVRQLEHAGLEPLVALFSVAFLPLDCDLVAVL